MTEEELKEFNNTLKKVRISTVVIIVLFLLLLLSINQCNNDSVKNSLNTTILNDNQKTFKDKDSLNHTTNTVIESNTKEFTNLKIKDEQIKSLQELVKKYKKQLASKGSVTHFKSETKINHSFPRVDTVYVEVVYENDQTDITRPTHAYFYPIKLKDEKDKVWVDGSAFANEQVLDLKLKTVNEYSVVIGEESQGWFKPKKPFVEVTNLNPYSETTKLKTYQVETKPAKKIAIGPGVYYGIGSDFKPQVFVGMGIQYNFIRF